MIVKAGPELRGSRTHGLLAYLLGPGRHTNHHDPRVVGGWLPVQLLPGLADTGRAILREVIDRAGKRLRRPDVSQLAAALDAPIKAVTSARRPDRPVWHCVVQNDPEQDPVLTDAQWATIADQLVTAVGLSDHRWVAVRHDDHGIHIAATLVDESGSRARLSFEKKRLNECRTRLERAYCRRRTDPGTRTGGVDYQRHEVEKARRENRPNTARAQLRRGINQACIATGNARDFEAHLARSGIRVGWRHSTQDPGQITGYKVALDGHTTAAGEPVWYKASDIDRSLTWPKIHARWQGRRRSDEGRSDEAVAHDYAARLRLAADRLRINPAMVANLQGPLGDIAASLTIAHVSTSGDHADAPIDACFWSTRTPGGAGRRRTDHLAGGLAAVGRSIALSGPNASKRWLLIVERSAEAMRALSAAHALENRRRQAEQALQVARHLEATASAISTSRSGRITHRESPAHPDIDRVSALTPRRL